MRKTIEAVFVAVFVAAGSWASESGPDPAGGGAGVAVPLLTGSVGPGKKAGSTDWEFNPLGLQNIHQTFSKDTGYFQILTVPADVAVQAVANAPVQWGIVAVAAVLATDTFGARTWIDHNVFGGNQDQDDDTGKANATEAKLPSQIVNSGPGNQYINNGSGQQVIVVPGAPVAAAE